jgi:putative heme iron utilization protein
MRRDLFVDRPFFGRRSCSLQFIHIDGGAMFKVFVRRDEKR